jgi:hypothetical protein
MALTYGSKNVDFGFSPILEPLLFNRNIFQPGISYTAKYEMNDMGEVFVRVLGKGAAVVGTPGSKFTNTDTADQIFSIPRNISLLRSEEIFDALAADVSYDAGASHLETALRVVQEKWNETIFAALVTGPAKTGVRVAQTGVALDKATIYGEVVDSIAALQANKARPTVMIVPPLTYAKLLKSPEFLRATDLGDRVVETGAIGVMAGLTVFLYEGASAYDYVIYDHDALAVHSRVDAFRLRDAIDFPGVYAQVKIDLGTAVTNGDRVLTRATNGDTTTTTSA